MQAAVIETPGQPPNVVDRERPPQPGRNQLAINVTAAPITPLDVLCASGKSYFGVPGTPYVPGVQGVGVVEEGTASMGRGRTVWFATQAGMRPGDGSMCAAVTVDERDVVPLPDGADQCWSALWGCPRSRRGWGRRRRDELAPGEQVAGSRRRRRRRPGGCAARPRGRGTAGRRCGPFRVGPGTATRAGPDALVHLEDSAEVDEVADAIRAQCDGPLDLVIDPLFGVRPRQPCGCCSPRPAREHRRRCRPTATIDSATLRGSSLRVLGYTNNELDPQQRNDALIRVVQEVVAGRLTVDREAASLADATAAWTRQVDGRAAGRIVLVPGV